MTKQLSIFFILIGGILVFSEPSNAGLNCANPQTDENCMVCNCFNEAGLEPQEGQVAVGKVVMTRAQINSYPRSKKLKRSSQRLCAIIKDPYQFSWFNKMKTRRSVPTGHSCFKNAKKAMAFKGMFADHYHATYVKPKWARKMKRVGKIKTHIFYMDYKGGPQRKAIIKPKTNYDYGTK